MTGNVEAVTTEREVPRSGFLRTAQAASEFHTVLTVEATDPELEIAEAKAVVALREEYKRVYPKPLQRITKTLQVEFDA